MSTATETPTVSVSQEIPAEGIVTVSLFQVDDAAYPNYRKQVSEMNVVQKTKSIDEHGQLQPCLGTWLENGKIGLLGGFTRFEAMQRLALKKLVKEYNEANGKTEPSQEGYIAIGGNGFASKVERLKIWQAGGEWKDKYEAALKSYKIDFKTVPVADKIDAGLKSIESNAHEKPPLMDLCAKIDGIIGDGAKAKDVAKALGMKESSVSHFRKIYACPSYLRQLFKGSLKELLPAAKQKDPGEEEVLRGTLMTAVGELERRLELEQADTHAISFSHAREFAYAVMAKDKDDTADKSEAKAMTLAGIAKLLRELVCMEDNGKLADRATPDLSVFRAKLRDAQRIGKTAEPTAAPAAATTAAPAGIDVSTLSEDQKKAMAEFDAAGAKMAPPATAPAAPAAAPAGPPVPTGVAAKPAAALSAEDAAKVAEVNAANDEMPAQREPGSPDDPDMDELLGPSVEELLAEEGAENAAVAATAATPPGTPAPVDGQMKSKTVESAAPTSRYQVKAPEKVEILANRMLDFAGSEDETTTLFDRLGFILASVKLFEAIGLNKEGQTLNALYVNYGEACNRYIKALENAVKEARGEAVFAELQQLKPKFERPKLG